MVVGSQSSFMPMRRRFSKTAAMSGRSSASLPSFSTREARVTTSCAGRVVWMPCPAPRNLPVMMAEGLAGGGAGHLGLRAALIASGGEVLVLDMGEPVRIADMARRLVANASRDVDIVFTGLRPGEKLAEDLLGEGEVDDRPHHPLIRHVPVAPLSPDAVIGIDPAAGADELRSALASCSGSDRAGMGPRWRAADAALRA